MLNILTSHAATLAILLMPAIAPGAAAPAPPQQSGDASSCMAITESNGHNAVRNDCGAPVELFWCTVGPDCDNDHGNTWTVGSGVTWTVGENVRWGACHGRNSGGFDRGTSGTRFTCN